MKKALTLFVLVIVTATVEEVNGQEKTCKQAVSEMLKYQMGSITKCTKELNYKGKEKTEKMNCIMKCVMIASGALKADGKIEIENAMSFVLEYLPLDVLEKALKGSLKCQRYMDALDPSDPFCKAYEPLVKCITGFVMGLCGK